MCVCNVCDRFSNIQTAITHKRLVVRDVPDSEFAGYPVPVIRPDNRILRQDTSYFSHFYYSCFQKQNFFDNSIVLFYEEKSFSLIIYLYALCLFFRAPEKC